MKERKAEIFRNTAETEISVKLKLENQSFCDLNTGVGFLDHMLEQLSRHGNLSLQINVKRIKSPDHHHVVEDCGIVLGQAFRKAIEDRKGIIRYASASIPMDESLVDVSLDLADRAFLSYNIKTENPKIGDFEVELAEEFWRAFVNNFGLTLHISKIRGENSHHIIESSFKAVAVALRNAIKYDPDKPNTMPSTKEIL